MSASRVYLFTCPLLFLFFLLFPTCHLQRGVQKRFPELSRIRSWQRDVDVALEKMFKSTSNADIMERGYGRLRSFWQVSQEDVFIPKEVVQEVKTISSKIFEESLEALKILRDTIESHARNFSFEVWTATDDESKDLKHVGGLLLSEDISGYQLPVDVHKGTYIKQEIKFSKVLDAAFRENQRTKKGIKWQYFASPSGLYRRYPIQRWPDGEGNDIEPDVFDVRWQPWYLATASSPKDIIMLIDTSGSVHGQVLQLLKLTAKMLLNTLGEDDYILIANFAEDVHSISCGEEMVPVTKANRAYLFQQLDELKDHGKADFSRALRYAYKKFEQLAEKMNHEPCNQMILFLSDGGTEDVGELVKSHQKEFRKDGCPIRIFSYSIGPHPIPQSALRTMACNSNGTFTSIHTMSAVRSRVLKSYIPTLNRPLALYKANVIPGDVVAWTSGFPDPGGAGLVISLTVPVFNYSTDSSTPEFSKFLGVVGVDISIKHLIETITTRKQLPPNALDSPYSYGFFLNENGILAYHPRLLPLHKSPVHQPSALGLDILDLEPWVKKIRDSLISRGNGSPDLEALVLAGFRYAFAKKLRYIHTNLQPSPLNYALVTLEAGDKRFQVRGRFTDWNRYSSQVTVQAPNMFIANWASCGGSLDNCSDHLKLDMAASLELLRNWSSVEVHPRADGIENRFIITAGGLTLPPSSNSELHRSQFFTQAAMHSQGILLSVTGTPEDPHVHLIKAIRPSEGPPTSLAAVVGVGIDVEYLNEPVQTPLLQVIPDEKSCRNPKELHCLMVDESGTIISSNVDPGAYIGRSLATKDSGLMNALVNEGLFKRLELHDYDGKCRKRRVTAAASRFETLLAWVPTLISYSWWESILATVTGALEPEVVKKIDEKESCILQMSRFYTPPGFRSTIRGEFSPNCSWADYKGLRQPDDIDCSRRQFTAHQLTKVPNGFLIIAEPPCPCESRPMLSDYELASQDSGMSIRVNGSHTCMMGGLRRVRRSSCYACHRKEGDTCGCSALNGSILPMILFLVLLICGSKILS
ncbi:unnamed protein product [Darwinula stevensoni]|uniref:VWFA domain-containing protein n=1 Tax=Darwinula stevensoni TaxID=69355 RepID=A0A7R8XLF1_9CRUS|nr:unnamed protein product [Darwinula stevensoni]CAG0894167.1 unnamed protein product [Darwinula stevensoni]